MAGKGQNERPEDAQEKFTKLTTSLISVYTYRFWDFGKNDRRSFLSVNGKRSTFMF